MIQVAALDQLLRQATSALERGRLDDAVRLSRSALKINPKHFFGLYVLGMSLASQEKFQEAADSLTRACKLNPEDFSLQYNTAKVFMDSGNLLQSIPHHKKAVALSPNDGNALLNFGVALFGLDRNAEALEIFDRILEMYPDHFLTLVNKSYALKNLKKYSESIDVLHYLIQLDNRYAEGWNNLACNFNDLERYSEAIECLEKALNIDSNYAEAYFNLGIALGGVDDNVAALAAYDRVISITADSAGASLWSNRGKVLNELKKYDEALESYNRALEIYPEYSQAYSNKAVTLNLMGKSQDALDCCQTALRFNAAGGDADIYLNQAVAFRRLDYRKEAEKAFKKAISINPNHAEAHVSLSTLYFEDFIFPQAWSQYEWRWDRKNPIQLKLSTSRPEWDGSPKVNNLLVWGEQGIGDQILYGSILGELESYPQKILVTTEKKLIPILQRAYPKFKFLDKSELIPEELYDEQIAIGSLGKFFRNSLEDFSRSPKAWLKSNSQITINLTKDLTSPNKKICGIAWKSSAKNVGEVKSLSLLQLKPILENRNLDFVNLQYGDVTEEINYTNQQLNNNNIYAIEALDLFDDVDGSLSLIDLCDIILTTSNSTAHLAGAMGKDVILLVPMTGLVMWYWHSIGNKNIWYPSITVLRQKKLGVWDQVIEEAKILLESKFG